MRFQFLVSICRFAIVMAALSAAGAGAGLGQGTATLRTPDGQPDLQGIWSLATITPMERPADLAGKEFFTPEEAAAYEAEVLNRTNRDRRDGTPDADLSRAYNDFWWDFGTTIVKTMRTSLVIDPPDGRIPPMTAAARERQAARAGANRGREFDGPENRPLPERCLIMQGAGPPMHPTGYNNNIQIIQSPGHIAIHVEMGNEVRLIPLDGRPHLPEHIRQWKGDSRGRWEGDTLVVETRNFTDKTAWRATSQDLRLIERFRRLDDDTLLYQFTIDDPETYERPWTAEIPMTRSEGLLFEYACHEGNRGMYNALSGARTLERAAGEAKTDLK